MGRVSERERPRERPREGGREKERGVERERSGGSQHDEGWRRGDGSHITIFFSVNRSCLLQLQNDQINEYASYANDMQIWES